jgi:hypothetical protein
MQNPQLSGRPDLLRRRIVAFGVAIGGQHHPAHKKRVTA